VSTAIIRIDAIDLIALAQLDRADEYSNSNDSERGIFCTL
jgi:hypothetical protein